MLVYSFCMGPPQVIRFSPSPRDHLAVEAGYGRERLLVKDALDGGAVSELTIETMSGEVTIGASSSGSN